LPSDDDEARQSNVGFIGYGAFGQYLSKQMSSHHKVRCIDPFDKVSSNHLNSLLIIIFRPFHRLML